MPGHDIVTIGASAGGVEILVDLVPRLPDDLAASLFIVMHTAPSPPSILPELLSDRGPLPAVHPVHGDRIVPGRIYVAPPDNQMVVRAGFIEVVRGPKENGHRPAVDATFRSAARAYGARVVGVILSGYQDCGTAGLLSVKARGGIGLVQAPETAVAPDMPLSALRSVQVDRVFRPDELPGLLAQVVAEPAPATAAPSSEVDALEGGRLGAAVPDIVCPLCQGALTETRAGTFRHFRCHVGHAFTLDSLARQQSEEMERALWGAVRALDEGASLSARLTRSGPDAQLRRRFAEKEANQRRQAEVIRRLLLEGGDEETVLGAGEEVQPRE